MIPFTFDGIPVYVNKHLGREFVQVKFPRSKKRRIRKKWRKNKLKYWAMRSTKDECFKMQPPGGQEMLIVSPSFFSKLKDQI